MRFPVELWDTDRERAAVLARAIEATTGPMAVIDAIGNVVFLNAEAEALWGAPSEALVNRAIVSLLGLDDRRQDADSFGESLEAGRPWEGVVRPRRAESKRRQAARPARVEPIVLRMRKGNRVLGGIVTIAAPKAGGR